MVEKNRKKGTYMLKKAFSIAEAIILVTVLAIALTATMPHLSKRVINNAQEGSSVGGASHGRYELYRDASGAYVSNLYSGTHPVYTNRVVTANGGAVDFTPPADAQNIMIYAVGGGGAGGGLNKNYGKPQVPKNDAATKASMLAEFERRFKEARSEIQYVNNSVPKFDGLVKINNDGTISAQADVNLAVVLPNHILNYTSELGAQTQQSTTKQMPKWFGWSDFSSSNKKNWATSIGCGGAGGDGGSLYWTTTKALGDDVCCMRDAFGCKLTSSTCKEYRTRPSYTYYTSCGSYTSFSSSNRYNYCTNTSSWCYDYSDTNCARYEQEYECKDPDDDDDDGSRECGYYDTDECDEWACDEYKYDHEGCDSRKTCPSKRYCYWRYCQYSKGGSYYTLQGNCCCDKYGSDNSDSGCFGSCTEPIEAVCKTMSCSVTTGCGVPCPRNGSSCTHSYLGSPGGAAPPCVTVQKNINKAMNILLACDGDGSDGGDCSTTQALGTTYNCSPGWGSTGRTCIMQVDDGIGKSVGGEGGCPYRQSYTITTVSTNLAGATEEEKARVEAALSDMASRVGASYEAAFIDQPGGGVAFLSTTAVDAFTSALDEVSEFVSTHTATTNSAETGYFMLSESFMCMALTSTSQSCDVEDGYPDCSQKGSATCTSGTPPAAEGRYNYDYEWTSPYMTNQLGYGESGMPGQFESVKISKVERGIPLKITVGDGGKWSGTQWHTKDVGPSGGNTVIKAGNKIILNAKGGEGGMGGFLSNKFDVCFALDVNKPCANGGTCCSTDKLDTNSIKVTQPKPSAFDENIRGIVSDSSLIGMGFGKSGNGGGTTPTNGNLVYGKRFVKNLHPLPGASLPSSPFSQTASGTNKTTENEPNPAFDAIINGQPGAVIIVW